MDDKIYDEASKVSAKDGTVIVDGPDGVDVNLTPAAALEISEQLLEGGLTAQGQQVEMDRKEQARAERRGAGDADRVGPDDF